MDKNIAALMREDTRTVRVSFDQVAEEFDELPNHQIEAPKRFSTQRAKAPDAKQYTYVTDLPLERGDTVVVEARGLLTVAFVREVDDGVDIPPNSDTLYRWVVCKIDLAGYAKNLERNREITTLVTDAYKVNLRRSFSQQILSGIDDSQRERVTALLKG